MEGIVEIHHHAVSYSPINGNYYCSYVYLDGKQCSEVWLSRPMKDVPGSRVFYREDVKRWIDAGGKI